MASDKCAFDVIATTSTTATIKDRYNGIEKVIRKTKSGIKDSFGDRYYFSDEYEEVTDFNY